MDTNNASFLILPKKQVMNHNKRLILYILQSHKYVLFFADLGLTAEQSVIFRDTLSLFSFKTIRVSGGIESYQLLLPYIKNKKEFFQLISGNIILCYTNTVDSFANFFLRGLALINFYTLMLQAVKVESDIFLVGTPEEVVIFRQMVEQIASNELPLLIFYAYHWIIVELIRSIKLVGINLITITENANCKSVIKIR